MSAVRRFNVRISGREDGQPILFAHGFGCDQAMWRHVAPSFEDSHRVILFDLAGSGAADPSAYDPNRHSRLGAYADDLLAICSELELDDVVFVGHSVSAMIGVLAANSEPDLFGSLVLVGPSPRYIDDLPYRGGFSRDDINDLLATMDTDYLGWSATMAPVIIGNPERPELGEELTTSFCQTDENVARQFARVTFLGDNREDLTQVSVPTLIIQCSDDAIAPEDVGRYVHSRIPESEFVMLDATGHCPHLSAPQETTAAIREFLSS